MKPTFPAALILGITAACLVAPVPNVSAEEAMADQPVRLSDAAMDSVTAGTARSTRNAKIAQAAPATAAAIAIPAYQDYTIRAKGT